MIFINPPSLDVLAGLNPGQDEIDEMIEETDKDHSGAIDFRWVLVRRVVLVVRSD